MNKYDIDIELERVGEKGQKERVLHMWLMGILAVMSISDIFFSQYAAVEKALTKHYISGAMAMLLIFLEIKQEKEEKSKTKDTPSVS